MIQVMMQTYIKKLNFRIFAIIAPIYGDIESIYKMKRIIMIFAAIAICVSAAAQAQITTRKEKLSDFAVRTMKVVLSGNHFIDPFLREAVNNTWSLSPFEFCSMDEFNSLKNSEEYYFMIPVKVKYKKEEKPGITMLTIVKGKATAKTVNDMVEVVSMPICAADIPSGREAAILPGLIDVMQGYVAKSLQGNFSGLSSYTTPLGKSSGRTAVIAEDDIAESVDSSFRAKMEKKGIDITSGSEADSIFLAGGKTLVSYVVTPSEPHKGAVCWKILIDSRTHELFLYKRQSVTSESSTGFQKGDLKKIAKTR